MFLIAGLLTLVTLLAVVFFQLTRPVRLPKYPDTWLDRLSARDYEPMIRLLSRADWEFVQAHPGATPAWKTEFRRERRRLVRNYMAALARDFDRMHTLLRLALINAKEDRPDLMSFLFRQRIAFAINMTKVRVRLTLDWAGIETRDIEQLIRSMESMTATTREAMATSAAA